MVLTVGLGESPLTEIDNSGVKVDENCFERVYSSMTGRCSNCPKGFRVRRSQRVSESAKGCRYHCLVFICIPRPREKAKGACTCFAGLLAGFSMGRGLHVFVYTFRNKWVHQTGSQPAESYMAGVSCFAFHPPFAVLAIGCTGRRVQPPLFPRRLSCRFWFSNDITACHDRCVQRENGIAGVRDLFSRY